MRLPRTITSPIGTVTSYTYDAKGNMTQTQVAKDSASMVSVQTWDSADMYVISATDAAGVTTTTVTDANMGTVTSTQTGSQSTVTNTYDVMKRVTQTSAPLGSKVVTSKYTYTTDRLTEVRHNTTGSADNQTTDVVYAFGFDALGRPTTTAIGGNTIFTQAYNTDGTLASQTFANGESVSYYYDSYKRMIGSATEEESGYWRYQYTYGANGELARLTDNNLGRTIHSEYDLTGRPMRKTTEGSDGTPIYTGEVSYDDGTACLPASWSGWARRAVSMSRPSPMTRSTGAQV